MADKTKTFSTRIKSKRDTSVNWESANPVLLNGEKIIVDTAAGEVREKIGDGVKTYSQLPFTDEKIRGLITEKADEVELERLKYYGNKDIIPSPASYFTVNSTGETIVGLTDAGKTQTELVIPYEINGKKITATCGEEGASIISDSTTITKIILPNTITNIDNWSFGANSSLTSINIPDSVTNIGDYAFVECPLSDIYIPEGVVSVGEAAFQSDGNNSRSLHIPKSLTSIGFGAFGYNTALKLVDIEYGTTFISGFESCYSLTSINIPNSVTTIGNGAFSDCPSLTSINIPNSVTSIEDFAFNACTSLTSINIPNGITSIGECTFQDCSSLTSINIPNGITSIGVNAFTNCSSLTSINISNSVTSIGINAFANCSSLTKIEIPNSVTSIGIDAFMGCSNLIIYCEPKSTAETYAKANNIPVKYIVGELPFKGEVDTYAELPTSANIGDMYIVNELVATSIDSIKYTGASSDLFDESWDEGNHLFKLKSSIISSDIYKPYIDFTVDSSGKAYIYNEIGKFVDECPGETSTNSGSILYELTGDNGGYLPDNISVYISKYSDTSGIKFGDGMVIWTGSKWHLI